MGAARKNVVGVVAGAARNGWVVCRFQARKRTGFGRNSFGTEISPCGDTSQNATDGPNLRTVQALHVASLSTCVARDCWLAPRYARRVDDLVHFFEHVAAKQKRRWLCLCLLTSILRAW